MRWLFEAVDDSVDFTMERNNFKERTLEHLKPVSQYIKKVKMSSVNRHGQWGIFIYCYGLFNKVKRDFSDGYSTYIPSDADDFMYEIIVDEIEAIYTDPTVKVMKD